MILLHRKCIENHERNNIQYKRNRCLYKNNNNKETDRGKEKKREIKWKH